MSGIAVVRRPVAGRASFHPPRHGLRGGVCAIGGHVLAVMLAGASSAWAAEPPAITPTAPAVEQGVLLETPPQWIAVTERSVSTIGAPVDVARLDTMRGGEDTPESLIVVDGTVEGNSADRIHSGSNHITNGAFDNANGINTVIQNTGTNVLIQNAMVVNVHFADPAP